MRIVSWVLYENCKIINCNLAVSIRGLTFWPRHASIEPVSHKNKNAQFRLNPPTGGKAKPSRGRVR